MPDAVPLVCGLKTAGLVLDPGSDLGQEYSNGERVVVTGGGEVVGVVPYPAPFGRGEGEPAP